MSATKRQIIYLLLGFLLVLCILTIVFIPMIGIFALLLYILAFVLLIFLKPEWMKKLEPAFVVKKRIEKEKRKMKEKIQGFTPNMKLQACMAGMEDIKIDSPDIVIGRKKDCDYVIDEKTISGYHCRITYRTNTKNYYIEDLNSRNGTYVNSQKLRTGSPMLLKSGNMVTIDKLQYNFVHM